MSSNLGYYISFTYQGSDINYPSWHAVSEATLYKTSEPDTPLGRLTYSPGIVTDLAGRTYSCSGCSNGIRSPAEWAGVSLTLPGESNPQLEATPIVVPYASKSIVSSIDRDGVTWNYTYGNARATPGYNYTYDNVVVTGPAGYRMIYNMKSATVGPTLVSSVVDALGRTTSYTYDDNFRLTQVTFPEDNWVEMTYDGYGNVISKITRAKPGSGLAAITESAGIDAAACDQNRVLCFRPTWYRDGLGRQTDYVYDGRGRLIQRTDPADSAGVRRVTYLSYGGSFTTPAQVRVCGLGTTCGTSAEIKTQYTYLGFTALPLTVTRTDGATGTTLTTTYTYDDAGRVLSEDGPLPGSDDSNHFRYDVLGRKTWEIGAANALGVRPARRYTYRNSDDRVVTVETGTVPEPSSTAFTLISRSNTTYDARRNPIKTALSSSDGVVRTVQSVSYDARGQLICSTVRMNPAAFGSVPADACVAGPQGSHGPDRITRNVYDTAGQLKQIQKAYGTPLQQNYATYTYSDNGQQASVTDANGNRAEMRYDGHDRQVRWVFPHRTSTGLVDEGDYEAYTYDAAGNRLSLRKRDGSTLSYQYDALNRVIRKTVPARAGLDAAHTRDVFYRYDIRGLQTDARFDSLSGHGVQTVYDGLGRATRVTDTMDGITRHLDYQYDAAGNRTRMTWPDAKYVTYTFGPGGQFDKMFWWTPAGGTTQFANADYNAQGRLANLNLASSDTSYTYDGLGRLASLSFTFADAPSNVTWSFTRNPASQIRTETQGNDAYNWDGHEDLTRSYAVNGLNQYTTVSGQSYCHDRNGNLTLDGTYVYLYDVENRLVEMRAKVNTNCLSLAYTGQLKAKLRYDPLGRLHEIEGFVSGVTQGVTRFLHDGDALVAEYNGSGAMLRRHAHGPLAGVDDPILSDEGSALDCSGTRVLHADPRGSIVAQANCWGTRTAINTYDEYGVPDTASAGITNFTADIANKGRFRYTGQVWLPELAMYYYKARIYSPLLGRFLQTDPIGYEDQINLYGYVANDPINGVDPSGTRTEGNTCSLTGRGSSCSGSYTGDGTVPQWTSRRAEQIYDRAAQRGDAYASTAKEFGKAEPENGDIARSKNALFKILLVRNGAQIVRKGEGPAPIDFLQYNKKVLSAALTEYRNIRTDLAVTYDRAMQSDSNGRASVNQVYDIHVEVFGRHSIPMTAFGGSPIFGSRIEAILTSPVWCPGCLGQ